MVLVADDPYSGWSFACKFGFGVRNDRKIFHDPKIVEEEFERPIDWKNRRK